MWVSDLTPGLCARPSLAPAMWRRRTAGEDRRGACRVGLGARGPSPGGSNIGASYSARGVTRGLEPVGSGGSPVTELWELREVSPTPVTLRELVNRGRGQTPL